MLHKVYLIIKKETEKFSVSFLIFLFLSVLLIRSEYVLNFKSIFLSSLGDVFFVKIE